MSHTYHKSLYHFIFSTHERRRLIVPAVQKRLYPYIGGIARENGMTALAIGGVEDHVHLLLSLLTALSIAKAMQLVKPGSSKWMHETFPDQVGFAWQEGYGAFSIGISQVDRTIAYINTHEEHHRTLTLQEEFVRFLKYHGITIDERSEFY